MKPGDILHAAAVPDGSLVRDAWGTYWLRFDHKTERGSIIKYGQVARGAGPWYAWGHGRFFWWPTTGEYELVATGLTRDVTTTELEQIAAAHEQAFGLMDEENPFVVLVAPVDG